MILFDQNKESTPERSEGVQFISSHWAESFPHPAHKGGFWKRIDLLPVSCPINNNRDSVCATERNLFPNLPTKVVSGRGLICWQFLAPLITTGIPFDEAPPSEARGCGGLSPPAHLHSTSRDTIRHWAESFPILSTKR